MRKKKIRWSKEAKNRKAIRSWKPKRFPRLKYKRSVLKIGILVLRATWNKINKAKGRRGEDVYKSSYQSNGEKAKHYFPIITNLLIQEQIGFSAYLKVLCEYGIYGKKKLMPQISWLAGPKALKTFDWLYESMRRENPNFEDWKWARDNPNDEQFDSNPSSLKIFDEIQHSTKHLQKFLTIHEDKVDIGCMTIFELEHLSPWYLALCGKFQEMDGMKFADKKTAKQIRQAENYYQKNPKVQKKSKKILTAFYNRNDRK